jgi:hypothetical protein
MARPSPTDRQLTQTVTDANFDELPQAIQWLWYRLFSLAICAPEKGRLFIFGRSVSAWVSRKFSLSETEAETQLETLAAIGLLELADDGIWMPGARAGASRVDAARANGSNGGRPRKGESTEQYRARKAHERELARSQGSLMMPLVGGRAETQETQMKPEAESSRAVPTTLTLSIENGSGSTAREETDAGSLVATLASDAGLDAAAARRLSPAPVAAWLAAGATPTLIREAVRRTASRRSYAPAKISTWKFFDGEVREALQAQRPPPAAAASTDAAAPPVPRITDQERAQQYLDMLAGRTPGSQQQLVSKASFLRQYCPGAWAIVEAAGQAHAA